MFQDGNMVGCNNVLPPYVSVCTCMYVCVCVFPLSLQNALLYEHSK